MSDLAHAIFLKKKKLVPNNLDDLYAVALNLHLLLGDSNGKMLTEMKKRERIPDKRKREFVRGPV